MEATPDEVQLTVRFSTKLPEEFKVPEEPIVSQPSAEDHFSLE